MSGRWSQWLDSAGQNNGDPAQRRNSRAMQQRRLRRSSRQVDADAGEVGLGRLASADAEGSQESMMDGDTAPTEEA
jgi:hypothetical protein